jgi:hypothetical protein
VRAAGEEAEQPKHEHDRGDDPEELHREARAEEDQCQQENEQQSEDR